MSRFASLSKLLGRPSVVIGAAMLLILLVGYGLQRLFTAQEERAGVEELMIARAERIMSAADGVMLRTLGALDTLATTQALESADWPALQRRLRTVQRTEPGWVTVRLTDLSNGRVIFDLRRPYGAAIAPDGFAVPRRPPGPGEAYADGVGGAGPGCPCAIAQRILFRDGAPAHALTVAIDTRQFLAVLARETPPGTMGAIVDRDGRYVARSVDHDARRGTPASDSMREAVRGAATGIYSGRTWEGFANYSAFTSSNVSGWSAHIAFSKGLIDSPRWNALAAAGLVIGAALGLAMLVAGFALLRLREARRVEERLQQAQKMETIGQFTGGIAHDFNNLMTPILGALDMLARTARLDRQARILLDNAHGAARKAARLTNQLLAFSRRRMPEIGAVDLVAMLDQARPLLDQSAGIGSSVEISVAPDVRWVRCDPVQLELALINLVLNARDAMPQGGRIAITASLAPADHGQKMAAIEVRDQGRGMTAAERERATEPFYTTKPAGRGTGLGLAQVATIVEQSGGTMNIASAAGRGTIVTLHLPVCDAPEPAPAPPRAAAAIAARPLEIVLCDDDHAVREFMLSVLDEARHATEAVTDGDAAIELVRRAVPDLLILDYAMPGTDGADVVRAVRSFQPRLPILVVTGHADTDRLDKIAGEVSLLRKPFDAGELLTAVDRAVVSP